MSKNQKPEAEPTTMVSLARMGLQIPAIIMCEVPKGTVRSLNVAAIPESGRAKIIDHLLSRGLNISLSNAYSTEKGDKLASLKERLNELQDGTFVPGQGGGGARATAQELGWQAWMEKDQGKKLAMKDVREWIASKCAATLVNSGKATKETVVSMLEAETPKWMSWYESKVPELGLAVRAAAAPKTAVEVDDSDYPG